MSGHNVTVGTASSNSTSLTPPNDTALAFPQVETTVSNANISNATVEIHLEKSTIEDRFVRPETIAFWVHNGTAWNRSTAPRVGETSSTLVYDLETTHFSTFAATADQDETPPSITDPTPAPGSTITNTQPEISAAYEDDFAGIDTDSVTLSIDGTTVTSGATVSSSSVSYTLSDPLDPGTYSVTVSVADAAGNTNDRSWSFTIEAEPTESPTDDGGGDDGGGGGGGGGGGSQVVEEPTEDDTGTSITGTRAKVDVTDGTAIESVIFHSSVEMNATVTVLELSTSPHPEPAGTTFVTAVDIVFVTGNGEDVERIGFAVPRSTITGMGVSADTLRVYHYDADAGQWEGLETTVVEETVDRVVVESPAAGFRRTAFSTPGLPRRTQSKKRHRR